MKKITLTLLIMVLVAGCLFSTGNIPLVAEHDVLGVFESTNIGKVSVTANRLNVRAGASTRFPIVGALNQGDVVDVIGKIGSWYVIHTSSDLVGAISSSYTKPVNNAPQSTPNPTQQQSTGMSYEQSRMLELVNAERAKAGLKALKWDNDIARVANYKAIDMVSNNYFSHTSPTYGSPFDMMQDFGIQYRYAGENLAGYNNVDSAHTGLMNSEGHRKNIMNSNFTHIGIGVQKSPRYGYVFVQMFVGR